MDGNGRWAKQRHLPRVAGHRAGAKVVREIVNYAGSIGLEVLTLFAFSTENRSRPPEEVQYLMSLFLESLQKETSALHEHNVCLRIIGDHSHFDEKLRQQIVASQRLTENNTGLTLAIAINYSGRWDILQAAQQLAQQVLQGNIAPEKINQQVLANYICLNNLPEPDLLIRTSGEKRLSNFMLWQFAYTELFFTDIYWPDFTAQAFQEAIACYRSRQRRFGLVE